jgi:ATP-binding cassette subfamily F protein 3
LLSTHCCSLPILTHTQVKLATFSQHHVDGLDLALTPLALMMRTYPGLKEHDARAQLGSFGINAELAGQAMYTLSGGQKNRVAFAKVRIPAVHAAPCSSLCPRPFPSCIRRTDPDFSSPPWLRLQLTFTKPHILLLDEPSNHLDIDAVNALIEGLATFKGGVLMVGLAARDC